MTSRFVEGPAWTRHAPARLLAILLWASLAVAVVSLPFLLPWENAFAIAFIGLIAIAAYGLLAYLAYRLWTRPARWVVVVVALIIIVPTAFALTRGSTLDWWTAVLSVVELALLVAVWNDDRIRGI